MLGTTSRNKYTCNFWETIYLFVGDIYVNLTYDLEELPYTEVCWEQKRNIDVAVLLFYFLVVDIAGQIWWSWE